MRGGGGRRKEVRGRGEEEKEGGGEEDKEERGVGKETYFSHTVTMNSEPEMKLIFKKPHLQ